MRAQRNLVLFCTSLCMLTYPPVCRSDAPEPRISVTVPMRIGERVTMCCFAQKYRNTEAQITFTVSPNDDSFLRHPNPYRDGTRLCYTLTAAEEHHYSEATCHARYVPFCLSFRGCVEETTAEQTLTVFKLTTPRIEGPGPTLVALLDQMLYWTCTVDEVTYIVSSEFRLEWLVDNVVQHGMVSVATAKRVRTVNSHVLRYHSQVVRLAMIATRFGYIDLECRASHDSLPRDQHLTSTKRVFVDIATTTTRATSPVNNVEQVSGSATNSAHNRPEDRTTSVLNALTAGSQQNGSAGITDTTTITSSSTMPSLQGETEEKNGGLSSGMLILVVGISTLAILVVLVIIYCAVSNATGKERKQRRDSRVPQAVAIGGRGGSVLYRGPSFSGARQALPFRPEMPPLVATSRSRSTLGPSGSYREYSYRDRGQPKPASRIMIMRDDPSSYTYTSGEPSELSTSMTESSY